MLDESTDISIHQDLMMNIRVLKRNHVDIVEPQTYLLGKDSLYRANAKSIFSKMTCILEQKGIYVKAMLGNTDGASVMIGSKSCVVTRIKRDVPRVLATHCIAHRLALSYCSVANSIPYLEILNSIYTFFHNSHKNTATLEATQSITPGQSGKFKEVLPTRLLSFMVLLRHSIEADYHIQILYVFHFMAVVLHPLAILSKSFQTKGIGFTEFNSLLITAVQKIEKCISRFRIISGHVTSVKEHKGIQMLPLLH
ncbi:hypothetical protein MAR_000158 [Mya arenaria]|uniref:DUF4371 domain-containing protein n=1 Tax=Mya arenaria TaxID=6604 RepID=A0ABY7F7Z8_MYAAR|nr:hypothetical protein MAR_000158 [Mya arenaria]